MPFGDERIKSEKQHGQAIGLDIQTQYTVHYGLSLTCLLFVLLFTLCGEITDYTVFETNW